MAARIRSLILLSAVIATVAMLAVSMFAVEQADITDANSSGQCGDSLYWTYTEDNHTLTITGSGAMWNWDEGSPPWWMFAKVIESIDLPDGLTSIGNFAFDNCACVVSIDIPGSVTSIGEYSFCECTHITSFYIPGSVTSIGENAFFKCESLEEIVVDPSNTSYCTDDGVLYDRERTALICCPAKLPATSLVVPDSVSVICDYAFCKCSNLTSVTLPDNLTTIGEGAFEDCSGLISITLPDSLTSIFANVFFGCSNLASVTLPNFLRHIGGEAFELCSSLTSITFPDSLKSIGDSAFMGCIGLISVTLPSSLTSIGESAFFNCETLTSVTLPSSLTSIGKWAFGDCAALTTVYNASSIDVRPGMYGLSDDVQVIPCATVVWKDWDGTVLYTSVAAMGSIPVYDGPTPSRSADGYTYTFIGWDPELSEVTGDIVYTAKYSAVGNTYRVTFDASEGVLSGDAEASATYGSAFIFDQTAERDGYAFMGWFTAGGVQITSGNIWSIASDTVLYAHWTALGPYTVTFDANDGILVGDKTAEAVCGTEFVFYQHAERIGYIFDGWFTADGMQISNGDIWTLAEDTVLYAHWTKI